MKPFTLGLVLVHVFITIVDCIDIIHINVTVGETALLKCPLLSKNSSIQWTKVDAKLIYSNGKEINPILTNFSKVAVIVNGENGEYHLQIKKIEKQDNGFYRCDGSIAGKARSAQVFLLVLDVASADNRTYVADSRKFTLYQGIGIYTAVLLILFIIPNLTAYGLKRQINCTRQNSAGTPEDVERNDDIIIIEGLPPVSRPVPPSQHSPWSSDTRSLGASWNNSESFYEESYLNPYCTLMDSRIHNCYDALCSVDMVSETGV